MASGDAEPSSHRPAPSVREPGTISLRPVVYILVALALVATTYFGYSCFSARTPGTTFIDDVAHYPPGSVTYLTSGRSYLVRTPSGDFLALSEIESQPADRVGGCVIRYRPDLQSNGEMGVFRDDCHGDLYDRAGEPLNA